MSTIGYATLVIIPTARGISSQVSRQIVAPVAKAGRTAGDQAGAGISTGINRTDYSGAGQGMVGPVARAGHRAGQQAGRAIQRGIDERDYEASGRDAGGRFVAGFGTGLRGLGTAFNIGAQGMRLFVVNASAIATGFGLAAKLVKSFSAATFISAIALQQVASTGLTRLAGALRLIAAIASRVANEIGQITAAFLVLQGVVKLASAMTNFAKRLAILTVGGAAAIGVIGGLATIVGGALSSALTAGAFALGAFAGAAAGLGGPALFALKVGMKGLSDGAAEFNKQFKDADEAMSKMVGQRMGPMLKAFRTMRVEMVDRFSKELEPAFARIGVGLDQVRGKFGWMAVYMGQIGQDIAMSLTGPGTIEAFQKMGDASGVFFQHLNKGESGLGGLANGLVAFASTAAVTFQDASSGLNEMFLGLGEKLRSITPEQIRGALSGFKQVFENISNVAGPLINLFVSMGRISAQGLAPGFVAIGNAIREATPALLHMASIIMPAMGRVMQELAPLIPRLVEAFTPWATTLANVAPHLASLLATMAPLAPYLLMIATGFKIAGAVMVVWNAASFTASVAQGVFAAATGRSAATLTGNTIALAAHRIALIAGAVAARGFGIAMAFATGPIGLIVLAVAAVGVALWAFFTKTETGKKMWDKIWAGMKVAVAATVNFLKGIWPAIQTGLKWIGDKAMWLWRDVFQPAFAGIGKTVSDWWDKNGTTVFNAVKTAIQTVGAVVGWLWNSVYKPYFGLIGALISGLWSGVLKPAFEGLKTAIGVVGDVVSWLWTSVFQPVFGFIGTVISAWWTGIVQPAFEGLKTAIGFVGDSISWWWTSVFQPVFGFIGALISAWWTGIVQPAFEGVKTAIGIVGDVVSWLWTSVFQPVFGFIGTVISGWWTGIVQPAFEGVKTAIGFVGDSISWWWTSVVQPAFSAAGTAISYFWDTIGSPIFNNIKVVIGLVGDAISWWWNSVAVPAFQAVGAVISWLWDNVASPAFEGIKSGVGLVGDAFSWFYDNVITPVFDGLGTAISSAWDLVSPIFDQIKSGIGLVGDAFGAAGGVIKSAWDAIPGIIRPAVHAIGNLLVKVPTKIGSFEIPGAGIAQDLGKKLQAFATGGTVGAAGRTPTGVLWGPGTGTSDSILGVDTAGVPTALVSTGEGVVMESAMNAGGDRLVAALNAGWVPSAATLAAMFPDLNAYATGGKVSRAQFLDQLRGIEGAAYEFGGWGNGWVTDCSGAQAKAANLIAYGDTETGGRFGTGTMAEALAERGALPGLGGTDDYNLGWYNGGPYGGHAAGSLPGGTGFEMGGPRGNGQYGGSATLASASKFSDHAHFPASMFTAAGTAAATTPPSSTDTGGSSDTGGSTDATATSVSRLKTFDELGADFASIFRAGLLETVGLDGELWTDPEAWLKGDTGDDARTTDNTQTGSDTSATPSSPAAESVAPSSSTGTGTGDANAAVPVDPSSSLTGSALYSYDIAKIARDMGMGELGAIIGNAVGLVETELKMYANSTVPESLSFAHDAVGSDSDSLGVMQQRASWGSVADRMTSQISAKLFMSALDDIPGWESMDPGAAAQAVQRSAFPHKYAGRMDEAADWVRKAGLFDTGGMLMPGGVAVSMLSKPEPLLPADKWDTAAANIDAVDRLLATITASGGSTNVTRGGDTYTYIANGYTAGDIATEWSRRQWARTSGYDGRGW